MKKQTRQLIKESLGKALAPPRRQVPKQKLDELLEQYDDGQPLIARSLNDQLDQKDRPDHSSHTGAHQSPVPISHQLLVPISHQYQEPEKNYIKVPNHVFDQLMASLDPYEFKIYLRLFRLSHGFHQTQCFVGYNALSKGCNLSIRHIKRVIPNLVSKGMIKPLKTYNEFKNKGTLYEILVPNSHQCPTVTSAQQSPIKRHDDDDDLLKDNHHQTRARVKKNDDDFSSHITDHQKKTQKLYEKVTGNGWQKGDVAAYQKIKDVDLEKIEQAISLATQRSSSRPNSLNYFVKEILNLAHPAQQSRTQQKKALEKIVRHVREIHVGGNYSMSDFVEDVKRACAREGVVFNNDLFNEIIAKR